jgi:hypothetical protein
MSGKKKSTTGRASSARPAQKALAQARSSHRRGGLLFGAGAVVVVALLVVVVVIATSSGSRQPNGASPSLTNSAAMTAVGRDIPPPWAAPADATAAARAAGLPMLDQEGAVEHIHAHLDVWVDGQPVEVPAFLGIDQARGRISPVHTHDATGVIHIESPAARQFSLGEFFSEWAVSLSADNLGSLRATGGKTVRVYVNGTLRTGNPAATIFTAHDEIALIYGQPQPRETVPAGYSFLQGE